MNELIQVNRQVIGSETVQAVNARELHTFLEVGKVFAAWIKARIEQYEFLEGQDFKLDFPILENQVGHGGDRRSMEYILTLDMAKELSMVERNEKGKQARRYFIECERRYFAQQNQQARLQQGQATITQQLSAHGVRLRLLDKLERERHPEKRIAIHEQLAHASRILGLNVPAIESIGEAAVLPETPPELERFWEVVKAIGLDRLNHANDPELIGLNLKQVMQVAAEQKYVLPPSIVLKKILRESRSPEFVDIRTMYSAVNKRLSEERIRGVRLPRTLKCWVFRK